MLLKKPCEPYPVWVLEKYEHLGAMLHSIFYGQLLLMLHIDFLSDLNRQQSHTGIGFQGFKVCFKNVT